MPTINELLNKSTKFFRHTHQAPYFEHLREEMYNVDDHDEAWVFHFCLHERGLTFEEICKDILFYVENTDIDMPSDPEFIWENIRYCLEKNIIRMEN